MASFFQRLGLQRLPPPSVSGEVKTLDEVTPKRLLNPEVKANSSALLPKGAYGMTYAFFSPNGGKTFFDLSEGATVLAFTAYWYVAVRWRAQKIAEAPLMVVREDQKDGSEEWLPKHELVSVLDEPSPDYDMGELLEMTSMYLDNTGAALWVKDIDNAGRVARLTPFSRNEFEPVRTRDRLYGSFKVQTSEGEKTYTAEECCFFRDNLGTWDKGKSRLDVATAWLRLSQRAMWSVYDLLTNSVWPSAVVVPDKDWNPGKDELDFYEQQLYRYGAPGNQGKPFVALGGGSFEPLQTSIKDIVPEEILGRVESVVSAVSGVPAIVLQFQIGMENSPWSQMPSARRMAYDDVIVPSWRKIERVTTRQLLRLVDDDPTHFLRFDRSKIDSLKPDELVDAQIATLWGNQASLNERRTKMGLEPVDPADDPEGRADEIPELTAPTAQEIAAGLVGGDNVDATDNPDAQAQSDGVAQQDAAKKKARRVWFERKFKAAQLIDAFKESDQTIWQVTSASQLKTDAHEIATIVEQTLAEPEVEVKGISIKARSKERTMIAIDGYLKGDSKTAWSRKLNSLAVKAVEKAGGVVAADMGVSFRKLHPNLLKFAAKETAKSVTQISSTTRSLISDIIQGGIDAKQSSSAIAALIRDATGFSASRAKLIARTETTQLYNGAPMESLAELGKSNGVKYTKTWSTAGDEKVRDEHAAMEGETVGIDDEFSNGLQYPSEPNCRCVLLYGEEGDE